MCRAVFLFHTCGICTPSIPPQLAVGANIVRPSLFAHMVYENSNLAVPRNGLSRAPAPTHLCLQFVCRKIASLFADLTLYMDIEKAVQSFTLRHRYVLFFSFCFFFFFSAPLSRLTPNEALPISCERSRTRNLLRQGLCPLTPQALWRRA